MTSYSVNYRGNRCIIITPKGTSYRFYRIPYGLLDKGKHGLELESDYVVYLLWGKGENGSDNLYVGTSTDGLRSRPTAHTDKKVDWKDCIVYTSFDKGFLNDSKIRFLEDRIRHAIDDSGKYVNQTKATTGKAANEEEKDDCMKVLPVIFEVYDMMGYDLTPKYRTDLRDYTDEKPHEKDKEHIVTTDYSSLKLPSEMEDWLKTAESAVISLDPKLKANVTSQYASYKYDKVSKTVAYCYPNRREKTIRVLFQGTPDWYNDKRVTNRPENMHNGDCKAMFFIRCADDLKYFRLFAEIAIQKLRESS